MKFCIMKGVAKERERILYSGGFRPSTFPRRNAKFNLLKFRPYA